MTDIPDLAGRIRRDLWTIRDFYDEALEPPRLTSGVKLPTQQVTGERMKYAPKVMRHSPPPADLGMIEARARAHADLLHYARVIQFEVTNIDGGLIQTRVDGDNIHDLARFIDTWAGRLVEQTSEGDMAAKDFGGHARALKHFARPDRRDWMPIGECPVTVADAEGNSVVCGATVRAYNREELDEAWTSETGRDPERKIRRIQFIRCSGCGTEDTLAWWMSQIVGNPDAKPLVTADELIFIVARDLGRVLSHTQIRQWVHRQKIPKAGRDLTGRALYDHAVIVALIRDGVAA